MPVIITQDNQDALKPLFKPWEEPSQHRLPNPDQAGGISLVQAGRRQSKVSTVRAIRAEVDNWRNGGYAGVSRTTQVLLNYWFRTEHLLETDEGKSISFHYHWAQREAIETFIYLYELRGLRSEAEMLLEFGTETMQQVALGILPQDDRWLRGCCKVATGGGKTKIMSLAIVWSYFHALKEPGSPLAKHFVLIAPNLTVYERLKDDFWNNAIFNRDPLIPDEWRSDFQMQVVLQEDPGGATTTGAIYLTNIHRLYDSKANGSSNAVDSNSIFGPEVARNRALETGESLRNRIATHPSIMVLNDEAHHLHDPELAWVKAINTLDQQSRSKNNAGICAQLDFTATPKHNDGSLFRHIICDFPLGEAVDAGIVKVPVIGQSDRLTVKGGAGVPATEKYRSHLQLGYERYIVELDRLSKVRKPILFVMTEDTDAANEITDYLNTDQFPQIKGKVLNVHTKLKGKIKKTTREGREVKEFIETETGMKDEDLRALREMSRELDSPDSKFRCVVSVMMLREGWDVRNVTTIIPLRPYRADSGILPEQTLGRGLRRMFPNQDTLEVVTVIEHPAFVKLYEEELQQEGLDIAIAPESENIRTSTSIFVDPEKPVKDLDIQIPLISDSLTMTSELKGLTIEEIQEFFDSRYKVLPIGKKKAGVIEYTERQLFTDELVMSMKIDEGLLDRSWSAAAFFARELGRACHLTSPHQELTPLIEQFISKVLFEREVNLFSGEVDHRMRDTDVAEHIRATFTPLIRQKTVQNIKRKPVSAGTCVSQWRPYQVTVTPNRPAVPAQRTLFNLVSCDSGFEQEFADFCDYASDVVAFAKNAGPNKLMIDYQNQTGNRSLYVPDFFIRSGNNLHYLVELKGRVDPQVPIKARAAIEWCKTSSTAEIKWQFLYVPYQLFAGSAPSTIEELARACEPSLQGLVTEAKNQQMALPLEETAAMQRSEDIFSQKLREAGITTPPAEFTDLMRQSVNLLDHAIRQKMPTFAHAFQPLLAPLDKLSQRIVESRLKPCVPAEGIARQDYFDPYLMGVPFPLDNQVKKNQRFLKDNLIFGRQMQLLGTLLFCLDFALNKNINIPGVWQDVAAKFKGDKARELYETLEQVNNFRNTRIAHIEESLTDPEVSWRSMIEWLTCINKMGLFLS